MAEQALQALEQESAARDAGCRCGGVAEKRAPWATRIPGWRCHRGCVSGRRRRAAEEARASRLELCDLSLRLLHGLLEEERPLHQEVTGVRLPCKRPVDQRLGLGILRAALRAGKLGEKVLQQLVLLRGHGFRPIEAFTMEEAGCGRVSRELQL